jgi:hypothetical protein
MGRYPQRRVADWMRSSRGSEKHHDGQQDAAVSAVIIDSFNERPPPLPRLFEKKTDRRSPRIRNLCGMNRLCLGRVNGIERTGELLLVSGFFLFALWTKSHVETHDLGPKRRPASRTHHYQLMPECFVFLHSCLLSPKSTAKKIERCYKKKCIRQLSEYGTGKSFTL